MTDDAIERIILSLDDLLARCITIEENIDKTLSILQEFGK